MSGAAARGTAATATAAAAAAAVPTISKNAAKKAAKRAAREALKAAKRGGAPPPPTDLLPVVNKNAKDCRRFKVLLQYDGAGFHGWLPQHPPGKAPLRTVGGTVEVAFRTALQQRVRICPSGRTDAGVSAVGQVCQFDAVLGAGESAAGLVPRLNAELPPDVRVRDVEVARPDFAAMGNLWKRYVYTVPNTTPPSAATATANSNSNEGGEAGGRAQHSAAATAGAAAAADAAAESAVGGEQQGQPSSSLPSSSPSPLIAFCRKTLQNDPRASAVTRLDLDAMRQAAAELEGASCTTVELPINRLAYYRISYASRFVYVSAVNHTVGHYVGL
eukprot:COSAG06_NODE_3962_length_4717_cov_3.863794_2_plen_331_part_00